MCTHRTCTPMAVTNQHVEGWVRRVFEMAAAVRRGLLPVTHLSPFASSALAGELVNHVAVEPSAIKAKLQWCKAEFLAISSADPPAYCGQLVQRNGALWLVSFQVLPRRRY